MAPTPNTPKKTKCIGTLASGNGCAMMGSHFTYSFNNKKELVNKVSGKAELAVIKTTINELKALAVHEQSANSMLEGVLK